MLSAVTVASLQTIAGLLVCKIHYTFAGRGGAGGIFMLATFWGIKLPMDTAPIHWLARAFEFLGLMATCSVLYGLWLDRRSPLAAQRTLVAADEAAGR